MDEIERKKQKKSKTNKDQSIKGEPLLKEKINWRTTLDFG